MSACTDLRPAGNLFLGFNSNRIYDAVNFNKNRQGLNIRIMQNTNRKSNSFLLWINVHFHIELA